VGNPNNKADALNLLVSGANAKAFRVSAYDHPNVVLGKELIAGAVTDTSIRDRKLLYASQQKLFDAMVRGICAEQSKDALFDSEWFDAIVENPNTDLTGSKLGLRHTLSEIAERAAGVDVAASDGGDKGCVAMGEPHTLTYLKEFTCSNASHLAYNLVYKPEQIISKGYNNYDIKNIFSEDIEPENVGVDSVGVGVSTIETFLDMGYDVISLSGGQWIDCIPKDDLNKPLWRFKNLRSQMYWELREDMRLKRVSLHIPLDIAKQLRKELLAIDIISSKTGQGGNSIAIEGKDSIKKKLKKSPNLADAVCYWNWVRKNPRRKGSCLPISAGS
jgi:hypothetical protein